MRSHILGAVKAPTMGSGDEYKENRKQMSNKSNGWIGVDLDGTLATYTEGQYPQIGEPIEKIVKTVKQVLKSGYEVRIVTARIEKWERLMTVYKFLRDSPEVTASERLMKELFDEVEEEAMRSRRPITNWCLTHIGVALEITAKKDFKMIKLIDDRAVAVNPNKGDSLWWEGGQAFNDGSWV